MNTIELIVKDYQNRYCNYHNNLNTFERNFFIYVNDNFKNEVNKFEYIDSKFINLGSNINTSKNICIIDLYLILTYKLDDFIHINTYILSLFSKNFSIIFSYQKVTENLEIKNSDINLEKLKNIENLDILTKKNTQYFHYNINKDINFENIRLVQNIIKNTLMN